MRTLTAGAAQDGHLLRVIEHPGGLAQGGVGRALNGGDVQNSEGERRRGALAQSNVAGHNDHGDAALRQRGAQRDPEDPRDLARVGDEFAEMAAILEELFGVRLLKETAADFLTRDLRSDRQHRNATAVAIEQAVDQMKISGATAAGAYRDRAGQMSVRPGGKRRRLLVPHGDPRDRIMAANRL